jgi:hypothetical protein
MKSAAMPSLPRAAAHRRSEPAPGGVAEKIAMEEGGWKTRSVFHRYAIVDNQAIADAMNLLARTTLDD